MCKHEQGFMPRIGFHSRDHSIDLKCEASMCWFNFPTFDGRICSCPSSVKLNANGNWYHEEVEES